MNSTELTPFFATVLKFSKSFGLQTTIGARKFNSVPIYVNNNHALLEVWR